MLTFTVPAIPVAQPRPKATAIGGHARVYSAAAKHPVNAFKAAVSFAAAHAIGPAPPLAGALCLEARFIFPRPGHMRWKTRPMPRVVHTKTPDLDNVVKSLLDAMNGVVFLDDKQVAVFLVDKWIAAGDERPHVDVSIYTIHDLEWNNDDQGPNT